MTDLDLTQRLERFGWLPIGSARSVLDRASVEAAAQAYASFYGLSGARALHAHLAARFCDVPDPVWVAPFGAQASAGLCRWAHSPVRVWSDFRLGTFTPERVREAFGWSLDRWASVCGFRWGWAEGPNRANILPHAKRIDGHAGTLAWSYLPCGGTDESTVLQQRYDDADPILVQSFEFFRAVVLHELGHALGLEHTNDQAAIMYPAARDNVLDLGGDDLPRIRRLYPGEGQTPVPTPPTGPGPGRGQVEEIGRFVGRYQDRPGRLVITFEAL